MSSSRVYIKPVGGLANRIRVINSALDRTQKAGKKLVVVWELNQDLNARYTQLFKVPEAFELIEQGAGLHFDGVSICYFPDKRPTGIQSILFKLMCVQRGINKVVWYNQLDQIFGELRKTYDPNINPSQDEIQVKAMPEINSLCSGLWSSNASSYASSSWSLGPEVEELFEMIPVSQLQTRINNLEIIRAKTVGLHIRRSDHTWAIKHSSDEAFINIIEAELEADPATMFFLATDNPEIGVKLSKLYTNKIIKVDHTSISRDEAGGIESAVIDLFGLSMCRKVYGSFLSTFSDLAAKIGNIESETAL